MFNQMMSGNIFGHFLKRCIGRRFKKLICYHSTQKSQKVESEPNSCNDSEVSKLQECLWEIVGAMV